MRALKGTIAAAEALLVLPAVLFMTALFLRNVQPQPAEPAHTAQQLVAWFSRHPHAGLWLLLMAMPFAVLTTGSAALWWQWRTDAELRRATRQAALAARTHFAVLLVALAILASTAVLAVVALHALSD